MVMGFRERRLGCRLYVDRQSDANILKKLDRMLVDGSFSNQTELIKRGIELAYEEVYGEEGARSFGIEDSINKKHVSFEERYKLRLQKEQPVLEAFWSWLEAQNPVKNSRLDKAVTYISNRREFLDTYLEDGRCSLHNNLSENAIRPFTVGRKNWLFSDSPQGAEASATAYSIVEMAKANNLNIYKYLTYILEQRPDNNWSDEQLETIAPWNKAVIDVCKNN